LWIKPIYAIIQNEPLLVSLCSSNKFALDFHQLSLKFVDLQIAKLYSGTLEAGLQKDELHDRAPKPISRRSSFMVELPNSHPLRSISKRSSSVVDLQMAELYGWLPNGQALWSVFKYILKLYSTFEFHALFVFGLCWPYG